MKKKNKDRKKLIKIFYFYKLKHVRRVLLDWHSIYLQNFHYGCIITASSMILKNLLI